MQAATPLSNHQDESRESGGGARAGTRWVMLSEVAKLQRRQATEEECRKLPYVGLEHLEKETGGFAPDFQQEPAEFLASKYKFSDKHLLYGKLRPYLNKVVEPSFEGVCSTEIIPILPDPSALDRTYLWGLLLTPQFVTWASETVAGANLPRLNPSDLASYRFPLPPLDEQRRIAKHLRLANRQRRLRRYALHLSEEYLQAVFLEMFGDPITNPMGWEVAKLGSLLADIESGWSPVSAEFPAPSGRWGVLRLGAVTSGLYLPQENKELLPSVRPRVELEVRTGDVLFSRKNTTDLIAACVLVHSTPPHLMIPDTIFRFVLSPDAPLINPYLWGVIRFPSFRKKVQILASGTAGSMPNISKGKLQNLVIPLPPLALQDAFARVVAQHERLRAQQREALRQANHLFDTLLHRAFSGGNASAMP